MSKTNDKALQKIAEELTTIRKILFEKLRFQMGIDADILKQLLKSEVSNDKKKTTKTVS